MTWKPFDRAPHCMLELVVLLINLKLELGNLFLQCLIHVRPFLFLSFMFFAFAFPFRRKTLSFSFSLFIFVGDYTLQLLNFEFLVFNDSQQLFSLLFFLIYFFLDVLGALTNFIKFLFHFSFKHLSLLDLSLELLMLHLQVKL